MSYIKIPNQFHPFSFFSLVFLFVFLLSACQRNEGNSANNKSGKTKGTPVVGVEVGDIAPDFKLKHLDGGESSLSDYRGKVVLVNFWATWCGPCKAEMPSMEALYGGYPRKDFEILAVSIDIDPDAPVEEFIRDFGFTFPVLLDDEFVVNDQYQIRVVPTSVVVDRKGIITHRLLGAKDWDAKDSHLFLDKLIATP